MNNLTPRKVAIAGGAGLAVLLFIAFLLFSVFPEEGRWAWHDGLIFSLIAGLIAYFLFFYLVRRFLQDRLRLIQRTVHGHKTRGGMNRKVDMDEDVLGEVHQEVEEWAEERKEEVERLREQEAFRRRFVGNVAHELKTPIFSIQGNILTLLEGALEDPENNRKFLERASRNVDRMTRIIEDLDTITQFESGRLEVNKAPGDPKEVARHVMETLEIRAEERKVRMKFKDPKAKVPNVMMDEGRIEQVLTNLLVNAIDHGKEGGKVELAFYQMEEQVLIEVTDDGEGIPEEQVPRIFERFYRVDKSRSRERGGTGLGLSIVKHILEAHGQSIDVRSEEGRGTTFSFTLEKA